MNFTQIEDALKSTKSNQPRWMQLTDEQLDAIVEKRQQLGIKDQKAFEGINHDSIRQLCDLSSTPDDTNSLNEDDD
jgi:hypothetical protein